MSHSTEDSDDDNDSVSDNFDDCSNGSIGWSPSAATDYDNDGCHDTLEDDDDDNDGVIDTSDGCALGDRGWIQEP